MRAIVTGMLATCPVGGVFWDYAQYAIGLERLGLDVWYLEDTGVPTYIPETGDFDYEGDHDRSAAYLRDTFAAVSPTLAERWHLRTFDDEILGVPLDEMLDIVADADVFLNVSQMCQLRDEYLATPRKVLIDTDPGWNHFGRWPQAEADPNPLDNGWRAHDHFFTYAERLGQPDCPLPRLGRRWHPTRPPVVTDLWPTDIPPGHAWTTVMTWDSSGIVDGIEHDGTTYATKEREFTRIEDLPRRTPVQLELAAGGKQPPTERWRELGWSVRDPVEVSGTPERYRDYLAGSRGEFSVTKHVYAATRSGWFSCRSTCYLAAARPVVVQDTGWSDVLPTGDGLFAFSGPDDAIAALELVESDWEHHSAAARAVAIEHFEAERVLGDLLDRVLSEDPRRGGAR